MHFAPWNIDHGKILTRREMALVLADLKARAERSPNAHFNLILYRLAACCGLRVSEIAQLRVGDVDVGQFRPHVKVRPDAAKGGRPRRVPLWWDAGTLADIAAWKAERVAQGAKAGDPFLQSQRSRASARPLSRHTLRRRFLTACRILGLERLGALTIHHGRHTFISHALAGGRTLPEVRDAAGHSNVSVTSAYLHMAVDGDERTGELFRF